MSKGNLVKECVFVTTFIIGLVILLGGAALYGRFCEKVFGPDDRKTPAYTKEDATVKAAADKIISDINAEYGKVFARTDVELNVTYFGDARNNMGNSLMVACAKMGMHFTACAPKELFPEEWLVEKARDIARETGGSVTLTEDVTQGATDADVIYTDIWVSMGEPDSVWSERIRLLTPYQVNEKVMAMTAPGAIFMHCLPSFHDTRTTIGADIAKKFGITEMEVTDQVFESKQSVVFDEAENRMHTIKAVIYATLH